MKSFKTRVVLLTLLAGCMLWLTPAIAQTKQQKLTTGQSFKLGDLQLPDGRDMMYVCVRGSVEDVLINEEPSRDYRQRGIPIEGAIVWLKRNPRLRAVTDSSGTFEIIAENGVLSASDDYKDDIIYVWKPGYKLAQFNVFRGAMSGKVAPGIRDSTIRISDYDATRYFKLERTDKWESLYAQEAKQKNLVALRGDVLRKKSRGDITPETYSKLQKPFPAACIMPDGRVVVEIDLTGTITDTKTGKPIQYAGVWLKRNPTMLAMTDENGQYRMKMEAIGLRPRTDELTNSICVSAGGYHAKEITLKNNYQGEVSISIDAYPALKHSGKSIEMIEIPAGFFRAGWGVTQGGGQGRDSIGDTSMWADYPVRTVTLPAYSIGKFPILRRQYYEVLTWAQKNGYDLKDPQGECGSVAGMSLAFGPTEPIIGINWYQSVKWCNALSEKEGRTPCYYDADGNVYRKGIDEEPRVKWKVNGYRLPTRAEWDHAVAGGTHFDFWWPEGFRNIRDYAYVYSDNRAQGLSSFTVHPVGKKKPTPFGLYDVTQVSERCWDWNGPYSGDETYHPKGCSREDAINFLKSFLLGFHQPERENPESEGVWGVGTCQGESDWSVIRRRYGHSTDDGHAGGMRLVISSQRGDENVKFPVVFDRLRGLPKPVNLAKITDKLDMVNVPAGSFDMGSGLPGGKCAPMQGKKFKGYDERPERQVHVSAFEIAKYETTLAQWNRVYKWALKKGYEFDNIASVGHSSSDDVRHPAVGMSWYDVIKWCNAASEMENLTPCYYMDLTQKVIYRKGQVENPVVNWQADGYRLPTEAQWEYAAFGGVNDSAYYWGNFLTKARDYAWFAGWRGDSGKDRPDAFREFFLNAEANWKSKMYKKYGQKMWSSENFFYPNYVSHPVGQKIGNRYGLYDVFGNAAEMCWDRMAPFMLTINDRLDPKGPATKEEVAIFLSKPYMLPGHSTGRKLRLSSRPTEPDLRALKGSSYLTGHGKGISSRHGPFLSTRSGVKPDEAHEEVGFRVARIVKNAKAAK